MTKKEHERRTNIEFASQEPFDWRGTKIMVLDKIAFCQVDRGYGQKEWKHIVKDRMNEDLLKYLRENSYTI